MSAAIPSKVPGSRARASRGRLLFACLAMLTGLPASGAPPESGPLPWSYEGERGPEHWGSLRPEYAPCGSGSLQSPIDIRPSDPPGVQPISYTPLMFQYRSQALKAVNDGREVRVLAVPGSELHVRGERYTLQELRFRVPGAHRFNGASAAGEIHLVHRDKLGRIAIVAVPLQVGRRLNSILVRILRGLPERPGEQVFHDQIGINPLFLIPSERDYYSYTGSLDTPPCSEPVLWYVMAHPLELEADQLRRIAQITGSNVRPVQPLNGRPVYLAVRGR
jgi:carbonic anhydrase